MNARDAARDVQDDPVRDVEETAARLRAAILGLRADIGRVIVGQREIVDALLCALLAGGHVLLEGVPGLGKTLLVKTLGRALALETARIQFTPDLMPADILGTQVLQNTPDGPVLTHQRGPIFHHLVLADEINRANPRTQAALLEAMAERQVTIGTTTHVLGPPFFVMATENPIDMEGTYPLPEAQADRFLLKLRVPRPDRETLLGILDVDPAERLPLVEPKVQRAELLSWQAHVRQLPAADAVREAIVDLVERTHPDRVPERFKPYVQLGVSPRGAQALLGAARARAASAGRLHVSLEDVRAMALDVLRHRVLLNFAARAEGVTADTVVSALLAAG
jgi:MoxR-like ATPase